MKTLASRTLRPASRALCTLLAAAGATLALSGCVPLIVGAAATGGALVATDRRTTGTQVEDQGIELKATNRIRELTDGKSHVNITSYDRQVLLTGEVFKEEDKAVITEAVSKIENVRQVVNELEVGWPSTP